MELRSEMSPAGTTEVSPTVQLRHRRFRVYRETTGILLKDFRL